MHKTVLASGVFDVLHPGHLSFLQQAKNLGDRLVVVVTSDARATETKHFTHHTAEQRRDLVDALAIVDAAFIGADPYDLIATVRQAQPDIIALGYDQEFEPDQLKNELAAASIFVEVIRLDKLEGVASTRDLNGSS